MIRIYLGAVLLGAGIISFSRPHTSSGSSVCSIVPFPTHRDPQITVFIGRGARDSVSAGRGSVGYRVGGGHWSSNRTDRDVFGQRILVSRLAGAESETLRAIFTARHDSSVVVVPWDYDPGCAPALWGRSFIWTTPDSVGVFTVQLRSREQWSAGIPTFDAFMADIEPYPFGLFYQEGYRGTDAVAKGNGLSVLEFFDFYLALPAFRRYGPDSLQYHKVVCDWARDHPEQARRFPASRVVGWEGCR